MFTLYTGIFLNVQLILKNKIIITPEKYLFFSLIIVFLKKKKNGFNFQFRDWLSVEN